MHHLPTRPLPAKSTPVATPSAEQFSPLALWLLAKLLIAILFTAALMALKPA